MLILTRKIGEKIIIGEDIVVTVTDIRGNQISLGIDAPLDVCIHRDEIHERIAQGSQDTKPGVAWKCVTNS